MPLFRYCVLLVICTLTCWFSPAQAQDFSTGSTATVDSEHSPQHSAPVTEWFNKYDQIRRDAEMTPAEKLQSFQLAAKKPQRSNAVLASRMVKKYTTALSEMKVLGSIPETKELQDGYVEFFSKARQLFVDYLDAQTHVPFTNCTLISTRKNLENLDQTNKKLDRELRKRYMIPKHKHR